MKKEKDSEARLKKRIEDLGGKVFKFLSPGCDGVPDRIVCLPNGAAWFIEMKTDKGKPSPRQRVVLKDLCDLKQNVTVLHGDTEVDRFIEMAKEQVNGNALQSLSVSGLLYKPGYLG